MTDILDILQEWFADEEKKGSDEAIFVKQIITEISSLRYLTARPTADVTVNTWRVIDATVVYAQHKVSCAVKYGRCTCGFNTQMEEFDRARNPRKYKEEDNSKES
jgi:hypothetical protein